MKNLNYGVIGNCRSAALISQEGSIEWCCLPDFNSASVFAKVLDRKKGGEFSVDVDKNYQITQEYIHDTNILTTKFTKGNDSFEVIDFLPRFESEEGGYFNPPDLIRYIKYISGAPKVKFIYDPKLYYAEYETETEIYDEYIKSYTTKGVYESVYLYTCIDLQDIVNQNEITLTRDAYFLLSYNQKIEEMKLNKIYLKLQRTREYWLRWSQRTYRTRKYNKEIRRSSLVLKLLTYEKTGAILAAVTTSIPETIGGVRNWDYRYCWIRDASMIINTLTQFGHFTSAKNFLDFIMDLIPAKDEKIQIMYGIRGEDRLTEKTLDHLAGYENSKPVRIGNSAYMQRQKDIYGVLMDVIYQNFKLYVKSQEGSEELWTLVRNIVKIVERNWTKPDKGIWEISSEQQHFTFSKVLCWVSIDRGMKIAKMIGKSNYEKQWRLLRDEIREDIIKNAWSEKLQSFKRSYESEDMDASNLLMEDYGFIDAGDPKYINTVKATKEHLLHEGLMFRYKNPDDFGKPSSSFTICAFWLVASLHKIGEEEEAEKMFNQVLQYSNHLGLFSENIDFETKRLLGNFPQGGSHLALINAALSLSKNNH